MIERTPEKTVDPEAFATALKTIRADREHGASELARRCLDVLARSAREIEAADGQVLSAELDWRAGALMAARPSMAPVQNLLARWRTSLYAVSETDIDAMRRRVAARALDLALESRQAVERIAAGAREAFASHEVLMSHSLSSTVVASLEALRHGLRRVIVSESRPLCEGCALAARLSAWGVPTTLVTDAQMGLFVVEADAVLVGADGVLADGAVVNKAGTYLLALAARDRGVPFYVCTEGFKAWPAGVEAPPLEEMDAAELSAPDLPHVRVRNVYFEITPARLISGWLTEDGLSHGWSGTV